MNFFSFFKKSFCVIGISLRMFLTIRFINWKEQGRAKIKKIRVTHSYCFFFHLFLTNVSNKNSNQTMTDSILLYLFLFFFFLTNYIFYFCIMLLFLKRFRPTLVGCYYFQFLLCSVES